MKRSSTSAQQPVLLTKKWLRIYFQIPQCDRYNRLRSHVITDELLAELGIDAEEYPRIYTFTATQSAKLRRLLNLPEPAQ